MPLGPASSSAQEAAADTTQNGTTLEKTPSQSQGNTQTPSSSVEKSTKKRSFRIVPSLSSLQSKSKKSATSLQQDGAAADRSSRNSQHPSEENDKRRDRSRASSRRSRRTHTPENNTHGTEPKVAIQEADGSPILQKESKPKGTPKVLVFFSCCTSSGVDHDEPVIAPKKSAIPRRIQGGRAVTPVQKAETGPVQCGTLDGKSPNIFDEKADVKGDGGGGGGGGGGGQQQSSSAWEKQENNNKAKVKNEKEEDTRLGPSDQTDGAVSSTTTGHASDSFTTTPSPATSDTTEQLPDFKSADILLDKQDLPATVSEHDQSGDAIMHDAPVTESKPGSYDLVSSTNNEPTQHTIPPPPPLDHPATPPEVLPGATEAEKPQYLLPPIQPHLKNRKCLVLDLDETLVHSSFKV